MMRSLKVFSWIGLFVVGMLLSACGGSSSSTVSPVDDTGSGATDTTISGVAAAGAPLSGFVTLVDSQGQPNPRLSTLINADGSFSFETANLNLVPPFFLRAEGTAGSTRYALHSVVTAPGTANINPLTEAQVKIATGIEPASLYENPQSSGVNFETMENALDLAADSLMEMLRPLLEAWQVPASNPTKQVGYIADGSGIDKLFDILNVDVATDRVEITNRSDDTVLASVTINETGGSDTILAINEQDVTSVATALDEIRAFLPAFVNGLKQIQAEYSSSDFSQAAQDSAREQVGAFFAQGDWVNFGYTREEEIEDFIGDDGFLEAIKGVTNARIVKENFREVEGVYLIDFFLVLQLGAGEETIYPEYSWALVKEGDSWKITGNGYYARIGDMAWFQTHRNISTNEINDVVGIRFDPVDKSHVFSSATVKGPGLPTDGIEFERGQIQVDPPLFSDYMQFVNTDLRACAFDISECRPLYNVFALNDAAIAEMDQVITYTMTYKFIDGSPDEVHSKNLVRPVLSNELNNDYFPEIHNLGVLTKNWALENLIGKPFNYQYSTPTTFNPVVAEFSVDFAWNDNGNWTDGWFDELLEVGQNLEESFTVPSGSGALQWFNLTLHTDDIQWRGYSTRYYFE